MAKGKTKDQDQYDSPWKEIIEQYFPEFMSFFFPEAKEEIDFDKGYEFLDKELQKVVRDATSSERRVDKLVQVWRKSGKQAWVYIHIDVQSQYETGFAKRMFTYNYRIFDRYQQPVATFVIYGDDRPTWQPNQYGYELWGTKVKIQFDTVKLLDYTDQKSWAKLDQSNNPFAIVVKAHLYTKYTKHKPQQRYNMKWQLIRSLYEHGYSKQEVLNLFHFIDWIMSLPKELTLKLTQQIADYEEGQKMRYVTTVERGGIEKGIIQTSRQNILGALQLRFPNVSLPTFIVEQVNSIDDATLLQKVFNLSVLVESMAKFEEELTQVSHA